MLLLYKILRVMEAGVKIRIIIKVSFRYAMHIAVRDSCFNRDIYAMNLIAISLITEASNERLENVFL